MVASLVFALVVCSDEVLVMQLVALMGHALVACLEFFLAAGLVVC